VNLQWNAYWKLMMTNAEEASEWCNTCIIVDIYQQNCSHSTSEWSICLIDIFDDWKSELTYEINSITICFSSSWFSFSNWEWWLQHQIMNLTYDFVNYIWS